jgi:hypothetical protein
MKKINKFVASLFFTAAFSCVALDEVKPTLEILSKNEIKNRRKNLSGLLSIIAGSSVASVSGYCLSMAKSGSVPKHLIIPLAIFSLFYSVDVIKDGVEKFNS